MKQPFAKLFIHINVSKQKQQMTELTRFLSDTMSLDDNRNILEKYFIYDFYVIHYTVTLVMCKLSFRFA